MKYLINLVRKCFLKNKMQHHIANEELYQGFRKALEDAGKRGVTIEEFQQGINNTKNLGI